MGDLLTTWNNLAALYHRHGATDHRDHVNHNIVGVAERFDGPLDSASTMVFMSVGDMYRKNRQFAPMLTLYRQVQRAMLSDTQMLDSTRALWLQRFASGLIEAGQDDAVEAALELAIVALDARSHAQPLSIGACHLLLAWRHEHQGDWRAAAQRIERVLTLPGLPAAELTEALSRAGRAWFKAGEFDAASRCCARAVRRRAGLESAQAQDASS